MRKIGLIAVALGFMVFMSGCQQLGKFEGKTAEEWFNLYDEADAKNSGLRNQLSDMESERDDLEGQYDDLQGCVEDYPNDAEYQCL